MERNMNKKELKMIFSVGVSIYSEKVTSYWYRFRWRSLMSDEEDIACSARFGPFLCLY